MKKNFFLILLIFSLLLNTWVLSNEDIKIKKIVEGLNLPAHLSKNEFISQNSVFVLEHKLGQIKEIQNYNKNPKINLKPILNIESLISENENWEQGINGFAFSPNFKEDKYIFVSYNNKENQIILSRFKYNDKIKHAEISSEVRLLSVERLSSDDTPEHNCGTISFNPKDNYLYTCLGDTRVPESAQNIKVLNGKILRIDPFNLSKNGKNYSFVRENPFTQLDGKPEILFLGFRNPWKFSFDSETGDIYIPDVGSEYIEELNIVKYENFNNYLNFGAGCFEGSYRIYDKHYEDTLNSKKLCLKNISDPSIRMIEPKLQYFHESLLSTSDNDYGNSITGGVVYKNNKSIWHNHYFFADFVTSNIWYLDTSKKKYIGINLYSGEYLGLTSINQVDDKLLATSEKGSIYEIILPNKKNLEKSIYNKPIIYNKLHAVDVMNRSNKIIFTTSSNFYKFLVKVRKIIKKLFGSNQ
jgi:hypothetical protein